MTPAFSLSIAVIFVLFFTNCTNHSSHPSDFSSNNSTPLELYKELANKILHLPLHCIQVEYPNRLGQVLGSAEDLRSPKDLHPIFYGCFDWHSAVHGYWSIVQILQQYPDLDANNEIRAI